MAVGLKKTRMMLLPDIKNGADMTLRLHTIRALDGQTDRIRKTISRSACIACWRVMLKINGSTGGAFALFQAYSSIDNPAQNSEVQGKETRPICCHRNIE